MRLSLSLASELVARSISARKIRGSAIGTADTIGDKALCSRGGWSRRDQLSSRFTLEAGITTGICNRAWIAICQWSIRQWPRC